MDKAVLAPVPVRQGGILRVYFDALPGKTEILLFDVEGQIISQLSFAGLDNTISTEKFAPGIYLAVINITYADNSRRKIIQKAVIIQ
jgi:hypothetical protein